LWFLHPQVSWKQSATHSIELLRTGRSKKSVLFCTPGPSKRDHIAIFDYTRFASPEAYGIKLGETTVRGGGVIRATHGMYFEVAYYSSDKPQPPSASNKDPVAKKASTVPPPAEASKEGPSSSSPARSVKYSPLHVEVVRNLNVAEKMAELKVWVGCKFQSRKRWLRFSFLSCEKTWEEGNFKDLYNVELTPEAVRVDGVIQDLADEDKIEMKCDLDINSYKRDVMSFGEQNPGEGCWFLVKPQQTR
jgi:hypothetical protein